MEYNVHMVLVPDHLLNLYAYQVVMIQQLVFQNTLVVLPHCDQYLLYHKNIDVIRLDTLFLEYPSPDRIYKVKMFGFNSILMNLYFLMDKLFEPCSSYHQALHLRIFIKFKVPYNFSCGAKHQGNINIFI